MIYNQLQPITTNYNQLQDNYNDLHPITINYKAIYNHLQSITRRLKIKYKYQLQDDYNDLQPITINYKTITMIYNQLQSSVSHNYDQLQGNLQ